MIDLSALHTMIGRRRHLGVMHVVFSLSYNTLAVLNHDVTGTCPPPLPIFGRTEGSLLSLLPVSLAIARGEFSATLREEVKNVIQVSSGLPVHLLRVPYKCHCKCPARWGSCVFYAMACAFFQFNNNDCLFTTHVTNLLMCNVNSTFSPPHSGVTMYMPV